MRLTIFILFFSIGLFAQGPHTGAAKCCKTVTASGTNTGCTDIEGEEIFILCEAIGEGDKRCGSLEKVDKNDEGYFKADCSQVDIDLFHTCQGTNCTPQDTLPEFKCLDDNGDPICYNYISGVSGGYGSSSIVVDADGNILDEVGGLTPNHVINSYAFNTAGVTSYVPFNAGVGQFPDAIWSGNNDCEFMYGIRESVSGGQNIIGFTGRQSQSVCCTDNILKNINVTTMTTLNNVTYVLRDPADIQHSILVCPSANSSCIDYATSLTISSTTNISSSVAPVTVPLVDTKIEFTPSGNVGDIWSITISTNCGDFTFFGDID